MADPTVPSSSDPDGERTTVLAVVSRYRRGLGRVTAFIAIASAISPLLLSLVVVILESLGLGARGAALRALGYSLDGALKLSPLLALVSMLFTSMPWPWRADATLHADARGLEIEIGDRRRLIPRDAIREGIVIPRITPRRLLNVTPPLPPTAAKPPRLELHLRGGDVITADVDAERRAQQLLDALGLGPERRKVGVTIGSMNRQLVSGCLAYVFGMPAIVLLLILLDLRVGSLPKPFFATAFLTLTLALLFVTLRLSRPKEIAIGADGVRLRRAWGTRFIPYSQVLDASTNDGVLHVRLKDGSIEAVSGGDDDTQTLEAIARRIGEAMALGAHEAEGTARAALLDRDGRPIAEWRAALRELHRRAASYRGVAIDPEELLAIAEDPSAPPARRIGAVLALEELPDAKPRLRIAAEACVSDPLREAFERAAEGELDEATIERAIAEESAR